MHHHLPDPETFPGETSLGTKQCNLIAGIVDVYTPLFDLEIIKGELVRDGLLSLVVEAAELFVNFVRRRPHPVDLPDSWGKAGRRVMPLRGFASSENHESREEPEEAVRLVTLSFAVLNRLLSEIYRTSIDLHYALDQLDESCLKTHVRQAQRSCMQRS